MNVFMNYDNKELSKNFINLTNELLFSFHILPKGCMACLMSIAWFHKGENQWSSTKLFKIRGYWVS